MRKALIILGILDDSDIEWMIENGQTVRLQVDDYLLRQNGHVEAIYFLLEGSLQVCLEHPEARDLALLEPGEVVGEISLLDSRPATATLKASESAILLSIPHDILKPKLEHDLGFQARFYKALGMFLAQRMRSTILAVGYGADPSKEEDEQIDEIEPQVLQAIEIAAKRFELMTSRAT